MSWGPRFNTEGECVRHNELGCPSCLLYQCGDHQRCIAELEAENKKLETECLSLIRQVGEQMRWRQETGFERNRLRSAAENAREVLRRVEPWDFVTDALAAINEALGKP